MPEDAQCSAGPAPGWCCPWPSGAVFRGRKDPGTCQLKLHPSGLGGAAGSQPPGHSCTPKTKPLMQEEDTREFRINHLLLLSSFSMLWPRLTACRILTPHPGAEPASPALKCAGLIQRAAREVPTAFYFTHFYPSPQNVAITFTP